MSALTDLANVEIEKPYVKNEYTPNVDKDEVSRLNVDYRNLSSTLELILKEIFTLRPGEEEVDGY